MTSKNLGIYLGIMAVLQFLAASTDLADLTSPKIAVWLQLIVGAAQAGMAIYAGRQALLPADPAHPDNLSSFQLRSMANKAETRENV